MPKLRFHASMTMRCVDWMKFRGGIAAMSTGLDDARVGLPDAGLDASCLRRTPALCEPDSAFDLELREDPRAVHFYRAHADEQRVGDRLLARGLEPITVLLVVNVLLIAAGNVMESPSIVPIMAPILFPVAQQLGIDPVHF